MSLDQSYIFKYISEVLLNYFSEAQINKGERYHIRYEQESQVRDQYHTLKQIAEIGSEIVEPFTFNDYTSYSIKFKNYRLIIAASGEGIAVDFLTGLRNKVADARKREFKDTAILFIHHTSLDSIIGGCKSLADTSMPLNVHYIRDHIKTKVNSEELFESYQKHILNYRIDQVGEGNDDAYSLFNYNIYLKILGKKSLEAVDYAALSLFPDTGLKNLNRADADKRLRQNELWFDEISNGHQYGGLDKLLERNFSQKGVDALSDPDFWKGNQFGQVSSWNEERNSTANIIYEPNKTDKTDDFQVLWDQAEDDTPAKSRIRHMIIFNYEHRDKINLSLKFTNNRPKKEGMGARFNLSEHEYVLSGYKILLNCKLTEPTQATYKNLTYSHPGFAEKYTFHILILPFREQLLLGVRNDYLIKVSKAKLYHLEFNISGQLVLNAGHVGKLTAEIKPNESYVMLDDRMLTLVAPTVSDDLEPEDIRFNLAYADILIPVQVAPQFKKPDLIWGSRVRHKKMLTGESLYYQAIDIQGTNDKKITLTDKEGKYYPRDEFRYNLLLEEQIIQTGCLAAFQENDKLLIPDDELTVATALADAYQAMIQYFRDQSLLPSLAALTPELQRLYTAYVNLFIEQLKELKDGQPLKQQELHLLRVGSVEMRYGNRLLKFTPLHPLNVAYTLRLKDALGSDQIPEYLLERLKPLNLVPYIKGQRRPRADSHYYYQPIDQESSDEWLYYFCDEISSQQVSRHFVPGLVDEKIEQFLFHFDYLFLHKQTPLRINLFNQGDTKEILQGIFNYYARFFRTDKLNPEQAKPIQVTIYGSKDYMTKFEELTLCDDVQFIEEAFDFKFPKVGEPDELFELYNKKVTFFKIDQADHYEYAHLSFYQFAADEVSKSSTNVIKEVPAGISLDGLMADVPSVFQRNSFRTGFGAQDLDFDKNQLLNLTGRMNAFTRITYSNDQYNPAEAIAFVINQQANPTVARVYNSTQWVTFIEPKVDLSFFKAYKDVVIIHYSDQYNNASGYDAITITSKWEPYKATILDVFKKQQVKTNAQSVLKIIDLFNAINGQWLLALNSPAKAKSQFRVEKLSMASAVKAALALLDHELITWVPISLEEILRISGAVGLRQTDGLFSAKNLGAEGAHADDLLMVGLEMKTNQLHLYFYPIEVKFGEVNSGTLTKAKVQSAHTGELLRKYLLDNQTISGQIYRNFFAKLVLINASKFDLYEIRPSYADRWKAIKAYRHKLLNDEFIVSNHLDASIGYYGVIVFKSNDEYLARSIKYQEDGGIVTLLKQDGLDYLTMDIDDLSIDFAAGEIDAILPKNLLRNRYPLDEEMVIETEPVSAGITAEMNELPFPVIESIEESVPGSSPALQFDRLSRQDIERTFNAVYEKLSAIGVAIQKQLAIDINFIEGPAFYRMEIKPAPTTTIKKIRNVIEELNIALQLPEEACVRIFSDFGKIWLEAPKPDDKKVMVTTAHIWPLFNRSNGFVVPFGVDITGTVQSINFSSPNTPHLLLAGATGSGKSVVLDTLIRGAAKFYSKEELQMFLIDPKGNELIEFESLAQVPKPNGLTSTDAIELLQGGIEEMDRRYTLFRELFKTAGSAAKDMIEYNQKVAVQQQLPSWLMILDEYSDLLDENPGNKTIIEDLVRRLSQKARAAGIHVIIATQKPLANIVSSVIKANLVGAIALKVRTGIDSRVILDEQGAETLAGKGDAIFKNGKMIRVQCAIYQR